MRVRGNAPLRSLEKSRMCFDSLTVGIVPKATRLTEVVVSVLCSITCSSIEKGATCG